MILEEKLLLANIEYRKIERERERESTYHHHLQQRTPFPIKALRLQSRIVHAQSIHIQCVSSLSGIQAILPDGIIARFSST